MQFLLWYQTERLAMFVTAAAASGRSYLQDGVAQGNRRVGGKTASA